jgi:phage shock protein C
MMFQTWRNLFHWFTGLSLVGGSLILYIIAAAIIPKAPEN